MKFGIFDQNDRSGRPITQQYDERLEMAELYDRLGFHCYHMSEHHATSLSMTPSQNIFMSAIAQRTKQLRLCPLVYLLPIQHPYRLAEEICMLDHLSHGRFEFGIGRGASPHELAAMGIDPADAAKMYAEAFEIMEQFFTSETLDFQGQFWKFDSVPVEQKPLQRPYPRVWYALASPDSTVWPARRGVNAVCGGPVDRIRAITDRYRHEWSEHHQGVAETPLIGVNRYIIVAETEKEALDIGRDAWPTFYENFIKLWRKHGTQPVNAKLPPDFDQLVASGHAVAGAAEHVTATLGHQIKNGGLNYLIGSFVFGSMPHAAAVDSVNRFARDVMPTLRSIAEPGWAGQQARVTVGAES
jgi:alkanesulfonate monooxygenase SsuD/methylene tetrahydromethanopterin reductase-like flavin-dependent oxidoreductase (luciferase family)